MNVLLVTTEYPPYIFGGGGTFAYTLANGLAARGSKVVVVTHGPRSEYVVENGVHVVRVPSPRVKPRHFWFQVKALPLVRRLVSTGKVDVVHANSFSGGIVFRFLRSIPRGRKTPKVVTVHGYPKHYLHISLYSTSFQANIGELVTYLVSYPSWEALLGQEVSVADATVAVAGFLARELQEEYGLSPSRVHHIPNGVDLEDLESKARECRVEERDCDVVAGGRFYFVKGLHIIPLVVRLLKDYGVRARFCLFGEGPYLDVTRRLAADLGVRESIVFLGKLSHKRAVCTLNSGKILFLPSLYEIMPMIFLEAVALEKPVVAFRAPYSLELAREGFRLWLSPSISGAARNIAMILSGVEDTVSAVKHNRGLLEKRYTVGAMVNSYLKLYGSLGAEG